jgi:hypothetical protein
MNIESELRNGLLRYLQSQKLKLKNRDISIVEARTIDEIGSIRPPALGITDIEVLIDEPLTSDTYEFKATVSFAFMVSAGKRPEEIMTALAEFKNVVFDVLKKSKSFGTDEAYGIFSNSIAFRKRENSEYVSEDGTAAANQFNAEITGYTSTPD